MSRPFNRHAAFNHHREKTEGGNQVQARSHERVVLQRRHRTSIGWLKTFADIGQFPKMRLAAIMMVGLAPKLHERPARVKRAIIRRMTIFDRLALDTDQTLVLHVVQSLRLEIGAARPSSNPCTPPPQRRRAWEKRHRRKAHQIAADRMQRSTRL
jgi:hypothetical protein